MHRLVLTALLAAVTASVGCTRPPQTMVTGEDWRAELSADPQTVAALRPVVLRFRLTDRNGAPLELFDLTAAADMPEMAHGATPVDLRRRAPGIYEAEHTFSMDGTWAILLTGRRNGAPFEARITISVGR